MRPQTKKVIFAIAYFLLIGVIAYNSYQLGTRQPKNIIVKGIDNIENNQVSNADFGLYWQVWDFIKKDYLKADKLDDTELIRGSTAGLANALDDPYSVFLPPEETKKFTDDIKGAFGGIGAEIGIRGDFIVIIAPLKNTPAERAGLKAGDKILAVGDVSTANQSIDNIINLIRGPAGSEVKLTILSNGNDEPKEVKIKREIIKIPTLEWKLLENDIAHLQLFNFNEISPRVMADALNELLKKGAQGLVLDLRNNPGGFLDKAVDIAGIFIERDQVVVSEEFRSGQRNEFKSHGNAVLKDFPMIVLVNKGSASASEILAGALRDINGVEIVGETSFGKGTVQELKNLSDGSTLKLTVAHWVLPKGAIIDGQGIKPDFEIKITEEDLKAKKDPQLEKAVELLKKQN